MAFDLNVLEVGNPVVLGMLEEEQEERVDAAVEYIARNYGYNVPESAIWEAIERFEVDYFNLPSYLSRRFDSFEVM